MTMSLSNAAQRNMAMRFSMMTAAVCAVMLLAACGRSHEGEMDMKAPLD